MERKILFTLFILFNYTITNSQEGSGTLQFNTPNGTENEQITVVATDLYSPAGSENTYTLNGLTNQTINFGPWALENTTGVHDYLQNQAGLSMRSNGTNEIDVFFTSNNPQASWAKIYNTIGQQVKTVKPDNHGSFGHLFVDMSSLAKGAYIVQIGTGEGIGSVKVLNTNVQGNGKDDPSTYQAFQKNSFAKMVGPNYKVVWDGPNVVKDSVNVEVLEGVNNNFTFDVTLEDLTNQHGLVAFSPLLNGNPENTFIATMTYNNNTYQEFTTGTQVIFDVEVLNGNNPTNYTIDFVDANPDGTPANEEGKFLPTSIQKDIYQDPTGAINGDNQVALNAIPNEQDLTTFVYDSNTLNKKSGQTVHLVRDEDNVTVDTQVTNTNGEVLFNDVPGSTNYHIVNEGTGTYKKTNGTLSVPLVDKISKMADTINTTSVGILKDINGIDIPANIVQMFKPTRYNTEFILGHLRIYFPPAAQRQTVINQFTEFATLLNMSGAIIPTDVEYSLPTQQQIDGYDPRIENRQVYQGQIGSNITNYSGGATSTAGKVLSDGNQVSFYTTVLDVGGLDEALNQHEAGNVIEIPAIDGNTTNFKTSRETNAAEVFTLQEATYDIPVMSKWLQLGKYHYDTTDAQGQVIEYNITTKFE